MAHRLTSKLNPKKRYLQVALNNTLEEVHKIIFIEQCGLQGNQIKLVSKTQEIQRCSKVGLRKKFN